MAQPWPEQPLSPCPIEIGNESGKKRVPQRKGSSIRAHPQKLSQPQPCPPAPVLIALVLIALVLIALVLIASVSAT